MTLPKGAATRSPSRPRWQRSSSIEAVTYLKRRADAAYADAELSVTMIAQEIGVSRPHLSRLFRATAGLGFREYLSQLRVEKAVQRLRLEPFVTIKQIAIECGFSGTGAMDRVFRERVGASPSALRLAAIREGCLAGGGRASKQA
jgi:AraC-like DNA-binding protein